MFVQVAKTYFCHHLQQKITKHDSTLDVCPSFELSGLFWGVSRWFHHKDKSFFKHNVTCTNSELPFRWPRIQQKNGPWNEQ